MITALMKRWETSWPFNSCVHRYVIVLQLVGAAARAAAASTRGVARHLARAVVHRWRAAPTKRRRGAGRPDRSIPRARATVAVQPVHGKSPTRTDALGQLPWAEPVFFRRFQDKDYDSF
uniref:Uncharacterized protein n=1 Tax=Oryza brachyantha TaxID=4533 RepID=J3LXY4_ORYBR